MSIQPHHWYPGLEYFSDSYLSEVIGVNLYPRPGQASHVCLQNPSECCLSTTPIPFSYLRSVVVTQMAESSSKQVPLSGRSSPPRCPFNAPHSTEIISSRKQLFLGDVNHLMIYGIDFMSLPLPTLTPNSGFVHHFILTMQQFS